MFRDAFFKLALLLSLSLQQHGLYVHFVCQNQKPRSAAVLAALSTVRLYLTSVTCPFAPAAEELCLVENAEVVFNHAVHASGKLQIAIHDKLELFGFSVMWEGLQGGLFVLNINVVYSDLFRLLLLFLPDPESALSLLKSQKDNLICLRHFKYGLSWCSNMMCI